MVRSLSEAMSTAIELVSQVIVARMRLAWTPWPSWTREYWLSRIHGMSRETASSTIACVEGPKAVRSARRMKASRSVSQSKSGSPSTRWLTRRTASSPGLEADLLVDVAVDDVVATLLALDLPGLAAPDVVADDLLERQRDVLGDVAQPGALVEPLDEAAAASARARVLAQAGQHRDQVVGEAGQRVGGELLERAEVDDEVDRLVVGPDVGAAVDARLEDLQVRRGSLAHARTRSLVARGTARVVAAGSLDRSSARALRASRRRSWRGTTSPAAMSRASWRRSRPASATLGVLGRRPPAPAGRASRVVRSNAAPAGSTCRTTPLASSGADRRGLVGVGDHARPVEDRDRAAAGHAQHLVAVDVLDDGRGVLVDADAEQLRALGHDHQQPAVAVALVEVLVDHGRGDEAEAGGDLGHPLLGGGPADAEGDHVRGLDARAGRGAGDDRTALVGVARSRRRTACRRRSPDSLSWLPPVMKMPVASSSASTRAGSCASSRDSGRTASHLGRAELGEERVVDVDDLAAERRGGRDDDDAGVVAAAGGDEVLEDRALAQLVLGAADDHEWSR